MGFPNPPGNKLINQPIQPVLPTLTLNQLWEYVDDMSPASGSMSFDDAAQSITFIIPTTTIDDGQFTPQLGGGASKYRTTGITLLNNGRVNKTSAMNYLYDAVVLLLGYTYTEELFFDPTKPISAPQVTNGGAGEPRLVLRKFLPLQHPLFPWMICTRIDSWQGVGPRGKRRANHYQVVRDAGLNIPEWTSEYKSVRLVATFSQPPYNVFPDREVVKFNELTPNVVGGSGAAPGRFIHREQTPSANMITLDKGSMVFAEGPLNTKPFTAPGYSQPETFQEYNFIWTQVPEEYVCNTNGDLVRFDAYMQTVNSATFLGRRPGTLLMEPYKVTRKRIPLAWTDGFPRFWLDIQINMKWFDPIGYYGSTETSEVTGTVTEGSKVITNVRSAGALATVWTTGRQIGDTVGAFGISTASKIVEYTSSTITLNYYAFSSGTNVPISFNRTKFGHLTAPAGMRGYFYIQTSSNAPGGASRDRYQGADFNNLFYPLTLAERSA